MTLADKAKRYAKEHPQEATLSWIDGTERAYPASKAVALCAVQRVAACVLSAKAEDRKMETMLNQLIEQQERNYDNGMGS